MPTPAATAGVDHGLAPPSPTTLNQHVDSDDGQHGALLVEEQRFAIVPEWVIDADISDGAFRLYTLLLRYGNGSGQRMPARATLARRMRRSVDAVDRAMRQLVAAGMVRVEHRRSGRQYLSNRYHVRTSAPFPAPPGPSPAGPQGGRSSAATAGPSTHAGEGGRTSAATPDRGSAATPGRGCAVGVAADMRPDREISTQRTTPPPPSPVSRTDGAGRGTAVEVVELSDERLLGECGIDGLKGLEDLSRRCGDARRALGQPAGRWTPTCLLVAIRMAVMNRGWPPGDVVAALLTVAADSQSRSPVRLAEAGPWWDQPAGDESADRADPAELAEAETRLADLGGRRVALQAQARTELAAEQMPLTRTTVTRRAIAILDRGQGQP